MVLLRVSNKNGGEDSTETFLCIVTYPAGSSVWLGSLFWTLCFDVAGVVAVDGAGLFCEALAAGGWIHITGKQHTLCSEVCTRAWIKTEIMLMSL